MPKAGCLGLRQLADTIAVYIEFPPTDVPHGEIRADKAEAPQPLMISTHVARADARQVHSVILSRVFLYELQTLRLPHLSDH